MSELVTFLGGLGPWLLVPLILLALLLIGYFDLYCQAMRPPVGTLEWISNYDRPPFSFARHRYRLSRWDAVPLCLICLLLGACGVAAAILLEDTSTQSSSATFLLLLLASLLELATVLLPGYLLLKRLYGSTRLASLGCAVALFANPLYLPVLSGMAFGLTAALWLLYCWMNIDPDTSGGRAIWALLLSIAAMLFAFLCDASAVFAVPGWLVLYGAALVLRFRRRTVAGRGRQLGGTVAITVLTALLLAAAASLITGILSGLAGLEALLVPLQYYSAIAVAQFQSLAQISWSSVLEQSFANPLLWWGGLFALCAALAVGCARHDGRPLFLLLGTLALLPVWFCTGTPALDLFAVAALCCVWDGFWRRGHRTAVWLYAGCTILLGILTLLSIWLSA